MKWSIWRKMILIHTLQKVFFPWSKRGKYIAVSRVFIFIQSEMLSHDNWTLLLRGLHYYGAKTLQQWRPWGYVHSCVKRQFKQSGEIKQSKHAESQLYWCCVQKSQASKFRFLPQLGLPPHNPLQSSSHSVHRSIYSGNHVTTKVWADWLQPEEVGG